MFGRPGFSGRRSWMNWLRRPRLNRAVHRVAVLTFSNCSRVAGCTARLLQKISEDVGLGHWLAEAGFQEVEVAAFVGLPDMAIEQPAIAAFGARRRRRQLSWGRGLSRAAVARRGPPRGQVAVDAVPGLARPQGPADGRLGRAV